MHARTVWDRLQRVVTSPSVEGIPWLHHITVLGLCACSCCHDRKCFCEFNQRDLPRQLASLDCSIAFSEIKLFYLFHQISVLCTLFTNTSVRYFILTLTYFYHFFFPWHSLLINTESKYSMIQSFFNSTFPDNCSSGWALYCLFLLLRPSCSVLTLSQAYGQASPP